MSNWKIDTINMDDLALFTEEELADRVGKCRSEMGKRAGDFEWRTRWEVELAYAMREMSMRHARRKKHQEYLDNEIAEENYMLAEDDSLPEYDGNRIPRYVKEVMGWN